MKMSLQDPTVKVVTVPESVVQQSSPDAKDGGRLNKKWICGIVGILVGIAIVAGTVLLAVHFGSTTATNAIKNYQINVQKNDGTTMKETVSVSETEEKYQTDESDFHVVYDMKNGFVVYKTQTSARSVCFIRPMNGSEVATPDKFETFPNGTTVSEESSGEQYRDAYSTTGIELKNRDLLSPMAREMCEGSPVMWLAKEHEGGRKKRLVCVIRCYYVLYRGWWWRVCFRVCN